MRLIKYAITLICAFLSLNVYANTCSYKEQALLNNDFSNVKITYEVVNDNKINILIYNITENIYLSYTNPETKNEETIYYINTTKGKYTIERNSDNIEEYIFKIRSNISACYGNILTSKRIIKPKYNNYHTLEICDNEKLVNHSYCQKFITGEITKTKSEIIKTLEEFLEARVDKITTTKAVDDSIDIKTVITYSSISLVVVATIVILLLIYKKRGEL